MPVKKGYKDKWLVRIRIDGQDIKVVTPAQTKKRAKEIDTAITAAVRYHNFSLLDEESRRVCVKLFKNRDWPLPLALIDYKGDDSSRREITLWDAIKLTLDSLHKQNNANRIRHEQVFFKHIGPYFGKNCLISNIWVPEIEEYMAHRLAEGASGSTVNKDRAALSKMFKVLIDHRLVTDNPVPKVDPANEAQNREVYLGWQDFVEIVEHLPGWMKPIIITLYYTGMRRGEALGLTWANVDLTDRIIFLRADQTKERSNKRIPIHRELIPTLEKAYGERSESSECVFLIDGKKPPSVHSLRKPWKYGLENAAPIKKGLRDKLPLLTIHDLRHTWKTNAMKSGVDEEIRKAIMGHSRGITGKYGRISNGDFLSAIDRMQFDHGVSEIDFTRTTK